MLKSLRKRQTLQCNKTGKEVVFLYIRALRIDKKFQAADYLNPNREKNN